MTALQTKSEITSNIIEDIQQISKLSNEPKCMADHRLAMWEAYLKELPPDRVQHLWKYSDPKWFELNEYSIETQPTKPQLTIEKEYLKKGIVFVEINEIFKLDSLKETIKNKFGLFVKKYPGKITYLNEATWSSGYFLYVPKNVKVEKPLIAKTICERADKSESIRILIVLEEDTSINLIDEISSSPNGDLLSNVVVEIFLAKGARLNYLDLQTHNKNVTQHIFQRAMIGENAELINLIVALGGKISKADIGAELVGRSASVTTYGIVLGDGIQKFDHHTKIDHIAPYSRSELDFRVALKDKSRSAYTGNLKITNEAIKSNAHQENRNLLLSNEAKAESIPELEILTNDVIRCNHGVTVGQVDRDQVYYLMSRGLNQKEAERIIIEGFLEPTISKIPDEHFREEVESQVQQKLQML